MTFKEKYYEGFISGFLIGFLLACLIIVIFKKPKINNMEKALFLIETERKRQIQVEGWTSEHDDEHKSGELGHAASAYYYNDASYFPWDWNDDWFKPTTRKRDLEKAGALTQAEIDRLERLKKNIAEELNIIINL